MRAALWILAVLITLELPAPAFQDQNPPFVLGVLRRDGIVSPFASFDGRRWRARWPLDMRNRDVPISLDDVPGEWWGIEPPPRTMAVWRDGVRSGSIALSGVTMVRPMCEARVGLKSDYRPTELAPPPFERPYPKDGLVASADLSLERIESVEKGSADWNRALSLITEPFNREETGAARSFTSWTHPVRENHRKEVPISMEAVYRAPSSDPEWTAHYVEAVRQYPPGPQDKDGCGLATFASGWVMIGPKDQTRVRISAQVTYCDRKGVGYMLPFGFIRASGKVYWIYQFSGFDEEWYEVAEPTRRGIESRVAYNAGTCNF